MDLKEESRKRNILVVDDSQTFSEVARLALERRGHHCEIASTGGEAIDLCRRNHFDLVFMDLELPDMDGTCVAMGIRVDHDDLPIIGLSGHDPQTVQDRIDGSGMALCLRKPYGVAELIRLLDEALNEARNGQ